MKFNSVNKTPSILNHSDANFLKKWTDFSAGSFCLVSKFSGIFHGGARYRSYDPLNDFGFRLRGGRQILRPGEEYKTVKTNFH